MDTLLGVLSHSALAIGLVAVSFVPGIRVDLNAYLFGDITAGDFDDLQNFARLYAASKDGTFPDARVLGNLRTKALARIPG